VKISSEYRYCGGLEKNNAPIGGRGQPLQSSKILELPSNLGTSLLVKEVNSENTVTYIRTYSGSLLKVRFVYCHRRRIVCCIQSISAIHVLCEQMKFVCIAVSTG
jgi:hypothetical protein